MHRDDSLSSLTDRQAIWIIIIVGLIVFFYIFFNGFVWDDVTYIIKNPELHKFNLWTLIGPNTFNSSGYFRPLPAVYFSLLYQFFGQTAFFYHLAQLLLHISCTALLYFIFRRFYDLPISLILSLVFLVHPINVESVAYIGSTQSQLYFLFGGLAFYLAIPKQLSIKRIMTIHLLLAGALFTKEISVIYFFLIIIYRWLNRHPVSWKFILSSTLVFLIYIPVRLAILGKFLHHMQLIPIAELPLWHRLLHVPAVFFYYLKTFIFPDILAINQIWTINQINLANFYLPLVFSLLFLFILYFGLFKFGRLYTFFLLWFLSGMAFLLQIFPLDMTVADRWFYFPIVGLLGIIGLVISRIKSRKYLYLFTGLILAILSIRTIFRTTDWHNPLILYSRDAGKFPNYDLENNLGAELAFSGDYVSALPHFQKAAELLPHDTNLYNVGSAYDYLQDYPNAKKYYQKSLEIQNDFPSHSQVRQLATVGLAKMLLLHDSAESANSFIRLAASQYPENGTLWGYLAVNEYQLNHYEAALAAAQKAKIFLPNETTDKLYQIIKNRRKLDLQWE